MLIRLSIPGENEHGGPLAVPGFGGQLQHRSIYGTDKEADVQVDYLYTDGQFSDGESYQLRKPVYTFLTPYIPMPANTMYSGRLASPVFGLGLLEAISETELVAHADENDSNNDGISGKPNYVWNVEKQQLMMGRFGWKAGQPTVMQQSAGAYSEDMGITNRLFPVESVHGQMQHNPATGTTETELSDSLLSAVTFYIQSLAVPARRNIDDPEVKKGKQIFASIGCGSCHTAKQKTTVNVVFPEISNQVIFPYTDLLLHDLGEGLSDQRPEFLANGNEWRTSPLWGIGLTGSVNGHTNFLHDGRARDFKEAILWHGGEAQPAADKFKTMPRADREALLKFLKSL
jgi:CxxC motif-containing protein (DUF1111 family)